MKNAKILLRFIRLLLLLVLVSAVAFAGAWVFYALQKDAYVETYYAELPAKVDRLKDTKGPRVIVRGGSYAAFGIDSKLIERELGMPCVNFGLYAAFGLKPMLDLSLKHIHSGDIVVIAPEISAQMYSTYCGYDYLLQAFEGEPLRLVTLPLSYQTGLINKIPAYAKEAASLRQSGTASAGVYSLSSFDAYGDIIYPRPENVMEMGYSRDNLPEIDVSIVTDDFLSMINDYARSVRKKGASVYFAFCPVNALSVKDVDAAEKQAFTDALKNGLDCPLLSPLEDHILDAGFFYDSNFHLNDTGVTYNSLLLVGDIQRVTGRMQKTSVSLPHAPALNVEYAVLLSGEENGFIYDLTNRGSVVTGLSEAVKAQSALTLPASLGGADVISVDAGAFEGSAAVQITLPETVTRLPGRLFEGARSLKTVYILSNDLPEVGDELLAGAGNIMLRVPKELLGTYVTDYFWGAYSANLAAIE